MWEEIIEVDYVLERQGLCIAIEMKSGRRTTNNGIVPSPTCR